MKTRLLSILLTATLLAVAAFTAFTFPAAAQTVDVRLPSGEIVKVDVPPGTSIDDIQLPGQPVSPTQAPASPEPAAPEPAPAPEPGPPSAGGGSAQGQSNSGRRLRRERNKAEKIVAERDPESEAEGKKTRRNKGDADRDGRAELRNSDGTPTPGNPGFVDALPGPSTAAGVPNFIIRKFRVPPFLLPIYQAAGIEYGIRWEVLAAINEIETDYGRNLNVSSAGALGWMQFMPATWKAYGTDGNKDGRKDPYNPVDAIFAAARYLKAANYENDVRAAIWAYNHADWYVDSVLLRARLIAGVPADLIGSLTGLTEGRFPVYA
ncbi:MAG TPA: lytic transglycosylase domain-containing protein, partial [Thermoleophilaceae bacterium]|nr:lytic transglycosylase domain-containing protein [Thermoleophilaceae bacterium]